MNDDFVFPQDTPWSENSPEPFLRKGGLTKLEFVAALIFTKGGDGSIRYAFDRAEEFLHEAKKRQTKP